MMRGDPVRFGAELKIEDSLFVNIGERTNITGLAHKDGTVAQQMAREGLERHFAENVVSPPLRGAPGVIPGQPAVYAPETVDVQVLRDALSRLRYMARQAAKRGTEANGPTTYEIKAARNALQSFLYDKNVAPGFAELDRKYGEMMDMQRQVDKLLKTVRLSRQNHAANAAYKATSGSLGGSLPQGRMGVVMSALDKMLTNKPGSAQAVSDYLLRAGNPHLLDQLLAKGSPLLPPRLQATPNALFSTVTPALSGLLHSEQEQ